MPPTDNMPDFDSMSPEEIQAWMETLAERQGATEGFTTDQRMDVQEIDPDSVQVKDDYIPYGKSKEEWEEIQARERAERDARRAAKSAPQSAPPASIPEPAPAVAEGGMPDFDAMSPEELQVWLTTLAERQGATEGFTTDRRMDVQEIDPTTVTVEDNYIPYGRSKEEWEEIQARERAERDARRAAKSAPQSAPSPEPEEIPLPESMDWLSGLAAVPDEAITEAATEEEHAFDIPDLSGLGDDLSAGLGDLDLDLGGLDLNADLDFDLEALDLGAFGNEDTDPMDWLDGLVSEQKSDVALPNFNAEVPAEKPELPMMEMDEGGEDTLEWLESLAKRQGADESEFVTGAGVPLDVVDLEPEPLPFDMRHQADDDDEIDVIDELDGEMESEDPAAWLDSLAESQKYTQPNVVDSLFDDYEASDKSYENVSTEKILADLNRGVSDPSMMKDWMDNLLERGADRDDVPDYIEEEDEEPALEANIPDWLLEQVGNAPPEALGEAVPDAGSDDILAGLRFDSDLSDDLGGAEMPDWLSEDPGEEEFEAQSAGDVPDWLHEELDTAQVDAISADIPEWLNEPLDEGLDDVQAVFTKPDIAAIAADDDEIDINDSWVEAFELERQMQMQGLDEIPESWLEGDLPEVETPTLDIELKEAVFEEDVLPIGEPESVPGWLDTSAQPMPVETTSEPEFVMEMDEADDDSDMPDWLREQQDTYDEEMPEWLAETGMETDEVPDWLLETISTDEVKGESIEEVLFEMPTRSTPTPPPVAPAPAPRPPVRVPVGFDADAELKHAKERLSLSQVSMALMHYENVVRADKHLNVVVEDLGKLVKDGPEKHNAAVYRVLGDALMRQGKLQAALDTYRRALNLL